VHAIDDAVTSASVSGEGDVADQRNPSPRRRTHDVHVFSSRSISTARTLDTTSDSKHFLAAAHFQNFFHGDQHAADLVLQAERGTRLSRLSLTFFSKPE